MKIWRLLGALALSFAAACASAGTAVKSEAEAIQRVVGAIRTFELTTLSDQCWLMGVTERPARFDFEIRERHTPECGGDPLTKPRLFTVRIRKHDGRMTSDVYDSTTFRPLDRKLAPR